MNDLKSIKQKLREEYKRRRKGFVAQLEPAVRNLVFRRPPSPLAQLIAKYQFIGIYHSIGAEAPTRRLAEFLVESGKTLAFPVTKPDEPLVFRAVDSLQLLERGLHNIPEPGPDDPAVDPELIIAPLVAFDRELRRLGQGGGHYDRTFEKYPDVPRIGLAWSVQEAPEIPVCSHDVTMQMIVTEIEVIQ